MEDAQDARRAHIGFKEKEHIDVQVNSVAPPFAGPHPIPKLHLTEEAATRQRARNIDALPAGWISFHFVKDLLDGLGKW